MLKIRLQRIGRRNQPYYRLVVTDSKFGPKSGRFIEIIGSYDPKAGNVTVETDRAKYWVEQGAQPSDTVHNFLVDKKVIDGNKINALPKKTAPEKEPEPVAETPTKEVAGDEAETASDEENTEETKEKVVETPVVEAEETLTETAEDSSTPATESEQVGSEQGKSEE